MTAERFGELLRRPLLLSGQNATELEELIAAYPWSGPLRRLRYQKAVLDGDVREVAYWRARAEPFLAPGLDDGSVDITAARDHARAQRHFGFSGDVAEEASQDVLAIIDEGPEAATTPETAERGTTPEEAAIPVAAESRPTPIAASPEVFYLAITEEVDLTPSAQDHSSVSEVWTSTAQYDGSDWPAPAETSAGVATFRNEVDAAASGLEVAEWFLQRNGLIMEYGRPQPAPIEMLRSYREWKQRRTQSSWQELLFLGLEGTPSGKTRKPKRSVAPIEPEVASETLADLLASQGHHEKAVRMYEQLALRHPQKRDNFAARIQALQHTSE